MKALKMLFAAAAAVTMTFTAQAAKTAKAVVADGGTTLRFVYDETDYGAKGTGWFSVAEAEAINPDNEDVPWYGKMWSKVTKVVFAESFAAYQPTSVANWFYNFTKLTAVEGVAYWDTSKTTTFYALFANCSGLTTLNLAGLSTASAKNVGAMFWGCTALTTIAATDSFAVPEAARSNNMFKNCTALFGGNGTPFDGDKTNGEYARIDKAGQPGYFTKVGATAKAVVEGTGDGKTLKFVYDETTPSGTKGTHWFDLADAESLKPTDDPLWYGCRSDVTEVVFNSSFAGYRPKHCGRWFRNFSKLTSVTGFGNLRLDKAKDLRFMFYECCELTSIDGSDCLTFYVQDMRYMFYNCKKLTGLNLRFDTGCVQDMSYMFYSCEALTELDLSSFNTQNVTNMNWMFGYCSNLEKIHVTDGFSTDAVASSTSMFYNCTKLVGGKGTGYDSAKKDATYARIDGKGGQPGYFTLMPWKYAQLDSLHVRLGSCSQTDGTVLIPKTINGFEVVSIAIGAFADCTNVTEFAVESDNANFAVEDGLLYNKDKTTLIRCPPGKAGAVTIPQTVTSMNADAFAGCGGVTAFNVESGNAAFTSIDGALYDYPKRQTLLLCPPSGKTTLVLAPTISTVKEGVFASCTELKTVYGSGGTVADLSQRLATGQAAESVIGIVFTSYFADGADRAKISGACNYGDTLVLPNEIDGEEVWFVGLSAFEGETALKTVTLPSKLKEIRGSAFKDCTSLSSIELPAGLTTLGASAFENCTSLSSIELPAGLATLGASAFRNCTSLESIVLPEGLTDISTHVFKGCTALKTVTLPSKLEKIPQSMFSGCWSLSSIELPNGLTEIGNDAFLLCAALSSIELPDGLTTLGNYAFDSCTALVSITIPPGVSAVGDYAFEGCEKLESVTLSEGVVSLGSSAFIGTALKTVTLPSTLKTVNEFSFSACTNLTDILCSADNLYFTSVDGVLYDKQKVVLEAYPSGRPGGFSVPDGVVQVGPLSFAYSKVESVHLSADVKLVGQEYTAFTFAYCLREITVDAGNTSFTSVDGVLYDKAMSKLVCCPMARTGGLKIPSGVTIVEPMACFDCWDLSYVQIPKSVLSIGPGAFLDDSYEAAITTFYVEPGDRDRVAGLLTDSYLDVSTVTIIEGEPPPAGSYGIHFDANGGTGTMADQICARGKVWNLAKCAFKAPTGKAFAGWACKDTGRRYDDGVLVFDLAASGKTVTMTAVWK